MWNRRPALVYTEHGRLSDARPSWKRRLVNPWLSRFDAAFVAVSHELRDHMVDARFPGERVGVIHNGIDAGAVPTPFDRHHARHLLGVDDEAFTVFTVARLDPVKDLLTLLDAFAIVRKQISSSRLVIVGDGPERETLSRRAASPDLSRSVRITGFRSDVRKVLAAADVYVNSSVSEGVSITILEALAARIPVVATAVGGTPEVVSDGSEGMLVPPRAPARMAAAILALAHDPQQRRALGAAGRVRVEDAFTIERMVAEYAALYRTLVD